MSTGHHGQPSPSIPRVLSIAGTDPTGGAGAQADIKAIAAAGGFALSAITALVAQNTRGVQSIYNPPANILGAQLQAISEDVEIDAVKIGMLGSLDYITEVSRWLSENRPSLLVIDPVMIAASGDRLLEPEAESALLELLPQASLITPNTDELAALAGVPRAEITTFEHACAIGQQLAERLDTLVMIKGGHLTGPTVSNAIVDAHAIIAQASCPRLLASADHGTGCSLASAMATRLAAGDCLEDALSWATHWLYRAIYDAPALRVGQGNGPVDHTAWQRDLTAGGATDPWEHAVLSVPAELHCPQDLTLDWSADDFSDDVATPAIPAAGPWTELLWKVSLPVLQETRELNFLRGLADESLSEREFTIYQRQDALYLDQYGRAQSMLASKAHLPDEVIHWASCGAWVLQAEKELHRDWLAKHTGGSFEKLATMPISPVTEGYTDFLLARTALEDYAIGCAAILPCHWLYCEIGFKLAGHNHRDHRYHDWLTMYGDEEYFSVVRQSIDIVERQMQAASPTSRALAVRAYLGAAVWEREFFAQASRMLSY